MRTYAVRGVAWLNLQKAQTSFIPHLPLVAQKGSEIYSHLQKGAPAAVAGLQQVFVSPEWQPVSRQTLLTALGVAVYRQEEIPVALLNTFEKGLQEIRPSPENWKSPFPPLGYYHKAKFFSGACLSGEKTDIVSAILEFLRSPEQFPCQIPQLFEVPIFLYGLRGVIKEDYQEICGQVQASLANFGLSLQGDAQLFGTFLTSLIELQNSRPFVLLSPIFEKLKPVAELYNLLVAVRRKDLRVLEKIGPVLASQETSEELRDDFIKIVRELRDGGEPNRNYLEQLIQKVLATPDIPDDISFVITALTPGKIVVSPELEKAVDREVSPPPAPPPSTFIPKHPSPAPGPRPTAVVTPGPTEKPAAPLVDVAKSYSGLLNLIIRHYPDILEAEEPPREKARRLQERLSAHPEFSGFMRSVPTEQRTEIFKNLFEFLSYIKRIAPDVNWQDFPAVLEAITRNLGRGH